VDPVTHTVTSPRDPPNPVIELTSSSPEPGSLNTDKTVCATFSTNAGGYSGQLTVTALSTSNSDTGTTALSVELCVDPGGPSQAVTFTATFTDQSRLDRTITPKTTTVTSAADPPPMTVTYTSSEPEPGTRNNNKTVCATFAADGGGLNVSLVVTDSKGGSSPKKTGTSFSVEQCANAGGANVAVKFTATLKDESGTGRSTQTTEYSVTSPDDIPPMTVAYDSFGYISNGWMCAYFTADGQGLDAQMIITSDISDAFDTRTGTGKFQGSYCLDPNASPKDSVTFTATVTDLSGYKRTSVSETHTVGLRLQPLPSPPTVTLSRSNTPSVNYPGCNYITVTTAHFSDTVTCSVTQCSAGGVEPSWTSWTQGPNETYTNQLICFGPGTVYGEVQCTGPGSESATSGYVSA